jgi:hypothetical protein
MTYVYHAKADAIIDTIIRIAHGLNYVAEPVDLERLAFMVTDDEWRTLCHYAAPSRFGADCDFKEITIAGLKVRRL